MCIKFVDNFQAPRKVGNRPMAVLNTGNANISSAGNGISGAMVTKMFVRILTSLDRMMFALISCYFFCTDKFRSFSVQRAYSDDCATLILNCKPQNSMYHASCNVSAPDQNFAADCDVFAQK